MAIENARLHARVQELALVEDRERIARDLHDTIVQRLFATGLSLQGAVGLMRTDIATATRRVQGAIDELDLTVKHIRSAIFGLEASAEGTHDGVRTRVLDLVSEAGPILEFEPTVLFEGPVDTATPEPVATDMLATLREALSNVAHHARADRVDVVVAVAGGELVLRVTDDGVGPPDPDQPRDHGLANIATRGTGRTGSLDIRAANPDGTVIDWRVPIK